jgi:hypothetical protein
MTGDVCRKCTEAFGISGKTLLSKPSVDRTIIIVIDVL